MEFTMNCSGFSGECHAPSDRSWDQYWEAVEKSSLLGKALEFFRYCFWVNSFVKVALEFSQKGKVLEAGCGSAKSSIKLRLIRGDNISVLDNSNRAINIVKKFSSKKGISVNIIKGDMLKMPFKDKIFDLVWNSATLEHFSNPAAAISEMRKIGKKVIIIIPQWNFAFKILDVITYRFKNIRKSFFEGNEVWYSADDFTKICIKAGLEEIIAKKIKCFYLFKYLAVIGK